MVPDFGARALRVGLIFDLAEAGGVEVSRRRPKTPIRCPLHNDRQASAFLSENNVFFCSVCTPNGGMSARAFASALGVDWRGTVSANVPRPRPGARPDSKTPFTAHEASIVWSRARDRMCNDEMVDADREAWNFISKRRLGEGFELSAFGILAEGMGLPAAVSLWPDTGYRLVAPLFDRRGVIANVQARAVIDRSPKTLFPAGSSVSGSLFACSRGVQVLRGEWYSAPCYLLGEGLTDHVALSIASPIPVLSAPGTSMAAAGVGTWVRDSVLYLALDLDDAGENVLDAVTQAAYRFGARKVHRVEWPGRAKDACDVVAERGVDGLERFLRIHLLEVAQ